MTRSLPPKKAIFSLLAAMAGSFLVMVDQNTINIAIPRMIEVFDTSIVIGQLIVSAQMLALAISVPISAYLMDRYGRRKIYSYALAIIIVANYLSFYVSDLRFLIVARILHGLGCGLLIPANMALVVGAFKIDKRGVALGIWTMGATAGLLVAPLLAGYLIDGPGWRYIFIATLPLATFALLFSLIVLENEKSSTQESAFDLGGYTLLALAIVCLMLSFDSKGLFGFSAAGNLTLLASAFILASFFYQHMRRERALIPLFLFKNDCFRLTIYLSLIRDWAIFSGVFLMPVLMQSKLGYTAIETGMVLLPQAFVVVLVSPISGKLADKYNPANVLISGFLILAIAHVALSFDEIQNALTPFIFMQMLRSFGLCLLIPTAFKTAFTTLPDSKQNSASTVVNLAQRLSGAIGVAITAKMLGYLAPEIAYQVVFYFLVFLSIPGIWISLRLRSALTATI